MATLCSKLLLLYLYNVITSKAIKHFNKKYLEESSRREQTPIDPAVSP